MDTQLPLDWPTPQGNGELDFGEVSPIVSSCAVCDTPLPIYDITVMQDGDHCCMKSKCHDRHNAEMLKE